MRQSLRFLDNDEFIGADIGHSVRSQLDPVISVLCISYEQTPSLLEFLERPDYVSVCILWCSIEELICGKRVGSALCKELKDVSLDLSQVVFVHGPGYSLCKDVTHSAESKDTELMLTHLAFLPEPPSPPGSSGAGPPTSLGGFEEGLVRVPSNRLDLNDPRSSVGGFGRWSGSPFYAGIEPSTGSRRWDSGPGATELLTQALATVGFGR